MTKVIKLVLATHNQHKTNELKMIIDSVLGMRASDYIVSAEEMRLPDVEETETSLQANAELKATSVYKQTGLPSLADDSGLIIDLMGQAPGIFSARWSGTHGDDQANRRLVLNQLADIPLDKRTAHFETACVLALPDANVSSKSTAKSHQPDSIIRPKSTSTSLSLRLVTSIGINAGKIIDQEIGENGFGYDAIFVSDEFPDRTQAQLAVFEKNSISHRARAVAGLFKELLTVFG
ncbi:MAG: non-canonical purine NTP pyrophosphatase [Bifidobacteriaceae bacterium]|nr:non-canonical purine NTP pyrophosphatase [Bifidobacteriaceae bacterium]